MRLEIFFDRNIIIEKERENKWVVYSPTNHKWCKTNNLTMNLIREIIKNKGKIETNNLTKKFNFDCNLKLSPPKIKKVIDKVVASGVFFLSKTDLQHSIESARKFYEIPRDQEIRVAYLHFTHRCNFNCWYCYNKRTTKDKSSELSTAEWIEIIQRLKARKVEKFPITGGEPLLRTDLYEILAKTKSDGIKFNLLTNGSLLTKNNIEKLNSVIDTFIVSFDGFAHDTQTKHQSKVGDKNTLEALSLLSHYAPKKTYVRTVVTKDNCNEIEDIRMRLKEEYRITHYMKTLFIPNSLDEINLVPQVSGGEELNDDFTLNYVPAFMKFRCGAATSIVAVDCRGDVYPCQCFIDEKRFRTCNVLEKNWYQKHLSSEIRELFRNLLVDNIDICKNCPYRYLCGAGCPAVVWHLYHNFSTPLLFLCKQLKNAAKERLMHVKTKKIL